MLGKKCIILNRIGIFDDFSVMVKILKVFVFQKNALHLFNSIPIIEKKSPLKGSYRKNEY